MSITATLRMMKLGKVLLLTSGALARESIELGNRRWHILPKHHEFLEMLLAATRTRLNPSYHWAFADEDYVGMVAELGKICHARTMTVSVLRRYSIRYRLHLYRETLV